MTKPLAVVLTSGGMDSCVTVAISMLDFTPALLHLSYGQRTAARERRAFQEIADHYKVSRRMDVSMEHLSKIGGSSLTDYSMAVSRANLQKADIPTSYVPFRNANMLAVGVSWAEVLGANAIFIGAVEEDSSGYPDCRAEFYEAFNRVIEEGTKPSTHITIITPLIRLSKAEIVRKGMELQAPLHLTWSCYEREDMACGTCDSCALRLRGFQLAAVEDPIPYVTRPQYETG